MILEKENNSENERPKEQNKRFKNVTEEICKTLEDQAQSSSTKRNTKWAVSNFEGEIFTKQINPIIKKNIYTKYLNKLLQCHLALKC